MYAEPLLQVRYFSITRQKCFIGRPQGREPCSWLEDEPVRFLEISVAKTGDLLGWKGKKLF